MQNTIEGSIRLKIYNNRQDQGLQKSGNFTTTKKKKKSETDECRANKRNGVKGGTAEPAPLGAQESKEMTIF